MYYGYIGYKQSKARVYVITRGHDTPEAAEAERAEKVKALPRGVCITDNNLSQGVIKHLYPIDIPAGYWGVAV
jgi:hypothetical protein